MRRTIGVLVDALQMRLVPQAHLLHLAPASRPRRAKRRGKRGERRPVRAGARRRLVSGKHVGRLRRAPASCSRTAAAVAGPMPGQKLQHAEAGDAVARVLGEAQQRQHVLDVGGIEKLEPAELDEGNVAPGQLDFELAAVVRGAEQHRLLLERNAGLAVRRGSARRRSAPDRPRRRRRPAPACRRRRAPTTGPW